MRAKAVVRVKFPSEKCLAVALDALNPEIAKPVAARSRESLKADGLTLVLSVAARDTVALRAALNAHLRWINCVLRLFRLLRTR
ncbi:MAG: KEOPS complex subunit Pcc1 [Candidatus Bathyarchaeia archaeon]